MENNDIFNRSTEIPSSNCDGDIVDFKTCMFVCKEHERAFAADL